MVCARIYAVVCVNNFNGSITDDSSVTTILPIPKEKNLNYSNSANYRGLAPSSIINKIFDADILNR